MQALIFNFQISLVTRTDTDEQNLYLGQVHLLKKLEY
jgi:hypothetical protein